MENPESGLVDIVRDFLEAYVLAGRIAAGYRANELAFEDVQRLVGDDEDAALFRLKEQCHQLFRRGATGRFWREGLFDLTVGALFHEAMKFRENYYQESVYGPKVKALRRQADEADAGLFLEFEKLLAAASVRLEETLLETETILQQALTQFRLLLAVHRENGLVTRYLMEHPDQAQAVFGAPLEDVFVELYGSAAAGWAQAAHSYLDSGYFDEAREALTRAGEVPGRDALLAYIGAMGAYVEGRHDESLTSLGRWLDASPEPVSGSLRTLARTAAQRMAARESQDGNPGLARAAEDLCARLETG